MPQERELRISGAVVPDDAAIEKLTGYEALGTPFEYQAVLVSESPTLDLSKFIGDKVTAQLEMDDSSFRYFNGYVTEAALIETFKRRARYRLTVRPFLYLLTARTNSRIFQNKTVPAIVKALLSEHGFTDLESPLEGNYPTLEYVVQYRESDFAFISRLMEASGIYYYFKHHEDSHVMVLSDAESAHGKPPGDTDTFVFRPVEQGRPSWPLDHVDTWEVKQRFQSSAFASKDFNFEMPRVDLLQRSKSTIKQKQAAGMEVFEYPGNYLTGGDGSQVVRTRIQELEKDVETVAAAGDLRALGTGELFTLDDHPISNQNKKYLVTAARFEVVNNDFESGASPPESPTNFRVHFDCIDSKTPFRPDRRTPLPRIEGPQTAIVVGEGGAEITTDKYGRVKVQFHWDREGKKDEHSSCWVRVSQAWAGGQWGAVHLPRIGQEVIVDFLEGNPDQPIVVGRVYNADNMVPYALPANKTQSGIKSRSSQGGAADNFNELRFEDKKGAEHVYLQAEKDLQILVKHDERRHVDHDRIKEITNDETVSIGHDRSETVGRNETITIGADRTEAVGGNETVTVAKSREHSIAIRETVNVGAARSVNVGAADTTSVGGSQGVSVGGGQSVDVGKDQATTIGANRSLTVGKDDTVTIGGKSVLSIEKDTTISVGTKMVIDVTDELTLKSGEASIILKKNGDITIKGKNITVDGSGKVNIKAGGDVVIKGSKVTGN